MSDDATKRAHRRANLRAWRARNPDRVREHNRRQAETHGESISAYKKRWREERVEEQRAKARERYAANPGPQKESARLWNRGHPEVIAALLAKRRAAQKKRTPPWLSEADLCAIRKQYALANALTRETGVRHHVDHVVPLQGKNVSGLHVPWNLQVLPASENSQKSNKW